MRKRGYSPEEIEKFTQKRAGSHRTEKTRQLIGYERDKDGNHDFTKPKFRTVGGERVSGYQHPAFKVVHAGVAKDRAQRDYDFAADQADQIEQHARGNVNLDLPNDYKSVYGDSTKEEKMNALYNSAAARKDRAKSALDNLHQNLKDAEKAEKSDQDVLRELMKKISDEDTTKKGSSSDSPPTPPPPKEPAH